jgi:nicotinamide riboside kinase
VKTNIISLYGGPGAGKSTSAAYLYYLLKTESQNVELVREYVKDWAWEGRKIGTYDQIYFLGKQVRHESMLYGKVDWIVTDSPILMNAYYASIYCTPNLGVGIQAATLAAYRQAMEDGHKHYNIYLNRSKPYIGDGRYQTEDQAKDIDLGVKNMLQKFDIQIIESETNEPDLAATLEKIKGKN